MRQARPPPKSIAPSAQQGELAHRPAPNELERAQAVAARAAIANASPGTVSAPQSVAPVAHLLGRVVETGGRPIEGALVELTLSTNPAIGGSGDAHADESACARDVHTDASGRFELALPLARATWVWIEASAGPLRRRLSASIDASRFVAADQELGDFVLEPAGAIRGRVFDPSGESLLGVRVEANRPLKHDEPFELDETGHFELAQLEPGPYIVAAFGTSDARLADRVVIVEPGQEIEVELELRPREPRITGIALDRWRRPLADVSLSGLPAQRDREARTRTEDDGSFVLHPRVAGRHEFRVGPRHARYSESLGSAAPGDAQIVLVDEHGFVLELRARDASSGEAIVSFAAGAVPLAHLGEEIVPPKSVSSDGCVRFHVDPRFDGVLVVADGYLPLAMPVAPDAGSPARQTVLLERGARLVGRIVGAPHARIALSADWLLSRERSSCYEVGYMDASAGTDVEGLFGPIVHALADERGAFELSGLPPGTYALEVHAPHGMLDLRRLRVEASETRDLGDLELESHARLEGRMRSTRAGPTSLHVAWSGTNGRPVSVDAAGEFVLERIPPGEHEFRLGDHGRPGETLGKHMLELAPGETRRVEWTVDGP